MLCGRDLMKTIKNKDKFVITMKLLEDNSGKKMGKTEGNMVALSDTPDEMYGKVMSWTDGLIIPGFELCTNVSTIEIENISKKLELNKDNPKDLKLKLAFEIVKIYHGEKKAIEAQNNWENTFSKKEIPDDVLEIKANKDDLLVDVLLENKLISSKSDFRRLFDEGAITKMETKEKISSYTEKVKGGVYKIGKKRFIKIL
jgi:tyrosyl-tRNA synthetase